jgi:hypothetical protein
MREVGLDDLQSKEESQAVIQVILVIWITFTLITHLTFMTYLIPFDLMVV